MTNTDFSTVLVANRGEIARRVFTTARNRGLSTVAVYSDADRNEPFTREADAAVHLPGNAPSETYLNVDAVLDAAKRTGADAVHPGYGFLSENASFARAVIAAGLTWIGPSPEAIDAMGSKTEAKKLMEAAGVPVLTNLETSEITEDMLPVLVKASAGGGGRGMRVVRTIDELESEAAAAVREAESAFGDGTVFIERYIESGRHIEVQLMADNHGGVWAVGERECSIQRRHQKVIEEAPSPLVERIDGMRDRLFEAARAAAHAIDYSGAGTVEFLANDRGEFFFLEVNTRLQVEHPVTEATTGLDLVGLQFDVAAGRTLPAENPPGINGWAVEARVYAEDPRHDYRPMSGEVLRFDFDDVVSSFSGPNVPGIRLDSGPEAAPGRPAVVGVHYDAMLAKVISWAPNRAEAVGRLSGTLRRGRIHGLGTNRDQLVRILDDADFRAGDINTAFLEKTHTEVSMNLLADDDAVAVSAFAAAVVDEAHTTSTRPNPHVRSGFRLFGDARTTHRYFRGQDTTSTDDEVEVTVVRTSRSTGAETTSLAGHDAVRLVEITPEAGVGPGSDGAATVIVDVDGIRRTLTVHRYPGGGVGVDSALGPVTLTERPRYDDPSDIVAEGALVAPMPGTVTSVLVAIGDTVATGQKLMTIEAMKMEHTISATSDGTVSELAAAAGDHIETGTLLAVIDSPENDE
ncbi:biotin carboxylase N-terminal domain-containing protein [Corynebacterium sp. USCH3]|uniref:acetyl/propionyl/methylcrotonyl-CoA carboxylase subunit alpha n=1 Tax=Corynebacterium sp. USCH3 TaxID=3024840 RepID=UPI0030A37F47